MKIGGLQKVSLIDYPERISAVLFMQSCNFRCSYCHNPELVDPARYGELLSEAEILAFLERRRGKLDAVTLSGGEPTLQRDLPAFAGRLRSMGFLVKVDTNGSCPDILERLIDAGAVDYLAMDVKGPPEEYQRIAHSDIAAETIRRSIALIMASGVAYEFRTTVVKSLLKTGDLSRVTALVKAARLFVLQGFVPSKTLDARLLEEAPFPRDELEQIRQSLEKELPCVVIR
jgi:pyruvate formate lyase activating enzyme